MSNKESRGRRAVFAVGGEKSIMERRKKDSHDWEKITAGQE